jgi:hypothetical protein
MVGERQIAANHGNDNLKESGVEILGLDNPRRRA